MSKIVMVCSAPGRTNQYSEIEINQLSERLAPDNIKIAKPIVREINGLLLGYFHGHDIGNVHDANAYVGNLLEPADSWWEIGSDVPDGSFALFRSDANTVELATDMLSSRTIWYAQTDELFVASTSQRSVVFFLRSFEPAKKPYSWMLANGTLGPDSSWDVRIKMLSPDTRLSLDRASWKIFLTSEETPFKPSDLSAEEHEKVFRHSIEDTFNALELDTSKWALPLSGGYDSRAILVMLKKRDGMSCYTIAPEQKNKRGTGYIAKALAEHYGLPIKFYKRGYLSKDPIDKVLMRYIVASEGRVDNVTGYYDGFDLWKSLYEENVCGIIRGDEIFGWKPVSNFKEVTRLLGVYFFSDYDNFPDPGTFGLEDMSWPSYLEPSNDETPRNWYNRVYQLFRVPCILSARTDCKSPYVDVINPLLSKKIVRAARQLPDYLQDDKQLFVKIVTSLSPDIPFHSSVSEAHDKTFRNTEKGNLVDLISTKQGVKLIKEELDSDYARSLLSGELVDFILDRMRVRETFIYRVKLQIRQFLRSIVPTKITKKTKSVINKNKEKKSNIDMNKLAFRAYIIVMMNKLLISDSQAL